AVSNPTPNLGETNAFTVTLTDVGPNDATNVQLTDQLPAGLTFLSATPSQGTYTSGTGLWDVGTVIAGGASQTLIIQAQVASPAPLTNTGSITHADQFDPDATNNSASVTETPPADLSVSKTVSNPTPNVGDTITFTVNLSNPGP